jgi:hypothetical protein
LVEGKVCHKEVLCLIDTLRIIVSY